MLWIPGTEQVNVIIYHFQDDVIGQHQPPAKYDRQLSSVAQNTAARSVPTSSKPGDKVRTDMHYRLTYFRDQLAN